MQAAEVTRNAELLEQPAYKPTKSFEEVEYSALKYCGLSIPDEIASFDVPISGESWVHEVRCGFHNKEDIVLLHGYGGTSMTFIRIFKDLASRFRVHALDFLGMGLSHRKEYDHKWDHHQTIAYYIDAIEQWRNALGIRSFVLSGHSFGGYLSMCYAKAHPERVSRLVLISPPGVMYMDSQISEHLYNEMRENSRFSRRLFLSLARSLINNGTTPSSAMNWCILGNMFLERILTGRLKLENEEKDAWKTYMKAVSSIRPNSERSFFKIFYFPKLGCLESIDKIVTENKFPFNIEFYYGDSDWMERGHAFTLVEKRPNNNRLSYSLVEGAGHQIIFDNPQRMSELILRGHQ